MPKWLVVAGALLMLGGGLHAQDSLEKIQKEMNLVYARGAKKGPDLKEVDALVGRALDVATDHKGEEAGFDAYSFVLDVAPSLGKERHAALFSEVMDALIEAHLDDDRLATIVLSHLGPAVPYPSIAKEATDYFTWIERDSKSAAVKNACMFMRADHDAGNASTLAEAKKQIAKLEALKKQIGDKAAIAGQTYGQLIDERLDSLKVVGTPAPEIEAADLDGVSFKLSEYRGKAVLLDFWGYW